MELVRVSIILILSTDIPKSDCCRFGIVAEEPTHTFRTVVAMPKYVATVCTYIKFIVHSQIQQWKSHPAS